MHSKELKLCNVWRTCNKIRSAIFRVGINLWDYYSPLDPYKNCLLSEAKFVSVLAGPLRETIGLSEEEIGELADYFRVQDGRILYTQFCEVINDNVPDFSKNEPLITGLEWEDPLHVNKLSVSELRRLDLLLTKIATVVNLKRMILRAYFQDYELIAKNTGTMTIAHFARIFAFLNIIINASEFNLIVKRYLKDSYTVNHVAFLNDLAERINYMDTHGILDVDGDVMGIFAGRVITANLPKLPRPEIGKIAIADIIGKQDNFHPAMNQPKMHEDLLTVVHRIQRHVLENRIRVCEFFKDWDPHHSGRITVNQFERGLEMLGIGRIHRLYLSPPEIETLIIQYRDPLDPYRVCWTTFENDIETVFTYKCLEKQPTMEVITPPTEILELPKKGTAAWQNVNPIQKDLCECVLEKIRRKVKARSILVKPAFRDYDKCNNGHVSRSQMRQCFITYGILLSDEEQYALEQRFNDDVGFNYFWFLKELAAEKFEAPIYESYLAQQKKVNAPKPKKTPTKNETDIVRVLAKIKSQLVREPVQVLQFLRDFDPHNENVITRINFKRGLDVCRFGLTENEVDTLMKVFASPKRNEFVDYRRFAGVLEEAFTQPILERSPKVIPLQHLSIRDCDKNFLNFEERHTVSMAMQKLSKKPEFVINLIDLFKDFDKTNCGTVTQFQLMKAFSTRRLHNLLSHTEFETLCKCFSYERGCQQEIDYRGLCKALDMLYIVNQSKPF